MQHYKPNTILITGGAGFIGRNFIDLLVGSRHHKLVNLDKLTYAGNDAGLTDYEQTGRLINVHGDICDYDLVYALLKKYDITTIVNFAAESHVDRSIVDPLIFTKSNVLGTASLLEAARRYWQTERRLNADACRFYHISTDEVFGSLAFDAAASTETDNYAPRSPYSASKAGADHIVHAYQHTFDLPIVMSHCSNNYGPYQHTEKFIPTVINACLNWQPIPIYGNGKNIRDWIYVEDHCVAIQTILETGIIGETYNIGANNQLSNNDLAHEICRLMDALYPSEASYATLISYVQDRLGHDLRYALNTDKIHQQLNWQASVDLSAGLSKTIHFYKNLHTSLNPETV